MAGRIIRGSFLLLVLGAIGVLAWLIGVRLLEADPVAEQRGERERTPAAVQVAAITTGPIVERHRFSGSLVPSSAFTVASKVSARIEELSVDVGDVVRRGQVLARLEAEEFEQAVVVAEASVAVAEARLVEARSAVGAAERSHQRVEALVERGGSSAAELDRADAERQARQAAVAVAVAQVQQATADLASARIRLGWCTITANWSSGGDERVVGQRFVDDGELVAVNQPLLSVLEISPLTAVIHVTERSYRLIDVDQIATLHTDAYGDEAFAATVERVAPRFDPASRQARIELTVPNTDRRLKPGMFVRVEVILAQEEAATLVPEQALISREGEAAVFVVDAGGESVSRIPVRIGLRDAGMVQVHGEALSGQVVVLGQQLISDGSRIRIPEAMPVIGAEPAAAGASAGP